MRKSTGEKTGRGKSTPAFSYLIIIPIIVVFFCGGVYVGSRIVAGTAPSLPTVGLPGTNNLFEKWGEGPNLRKNEPPASQPHAVISDLRGASGGESAGAGTATATAPFVPVSAPSGLHVSSLHATDRSFLTLPPLDHADVLVAAWIYLHQGEADMRTVFSNKGPGCDSSPAQYGLSLFVNAWQSADNRLYVEYGGMQSGCHKLSGAELSMERWYHVAVHASPTATRLYLDGALVASEVVSDPHLHVDKKVSVGVYDDTGQYPLAGNVSHFAVLHDVGGAGGAGAGAGAEEATVLAAVGMLMDPQQIPKAPGLVAWYPLADAGVEKAGRAVAYTGASKGALDGLYTFPQAMGNVMRGVKIPLVDGLTGAPTDADRAESDRVGRERRESVKKGFQHAWAGYKKYAWGRDEVKPLSNRGTDNWGGMGVTLVDSLDTLWLMGLKEEFREARDWVASSLSFDRAGTVSVFETTIRELGGLLAAYDLSKDKVFLTKAQQLADKLTPAFNSPSGIPYGMVNFKSGQPSGGWSGNSAILSELGSLQLEFRYLSQATQRSDYELKAMKAFQVMHRRKPASGLFPIKVSNRDGAFAESQITFGALGDSFYEYLLKVWIQGGRKETWLRDMYDAAMDGVMDKLLLASDPSGLAFLSDYNGRTNNRKMDHLVCFMPGALALGAYTDLNGLDSPRAQRDLAVAQALMYTCYQMYHRMKTGISAEYVEFPPRQDFVPGRSAQFYILRPETAESLFILNKLTGNPIYRDWAWEIWQAIDKTCKTPTAYGAIRNVNQAGGGGIDDRMESFFLAETMKYLYLAQDPDTEIDLNKVVFNTEAHPMKIFDDSHTPIPAQ